MDAHTATHSSTALHRAYLDAMRRHAERRAQQDEPPTEQILRAHRRAAAIERLRASVLELDIR